jgi:tetratricopeptide (TPR) repeat protein
MDKGAYERLLYNTKLTTEEIERMMVKQKELQVSKAIYDKGELELKNKNFSLAVNYFDEAEVSGYKSIELYFNRGLALFKSGEKEKACMDWLECARKGDNEALDLFKKLCNN